MHDQLQKPYGDVEHIFRRLGEAVVAQWINLPVKVRRLLLKEPLSVDSAKASRSAGEQFARFIASHIRTNANDN